MLTAQDSHLTKDSDGTVAGFASTEMRDLAVACVNALAGIPDPAEFVRGAREAESRIADLVAQASELNAALSKVLKERDSAIAISEKRKEACLAAAQCMSAYRTDPNVILMCEKAAALNSVQA